MNEICMKIFASKSLQELPDFKTLDKKVNIKYIDLNDEINIPSKHYIILIQNKISEGIYSDISFRCEKKIDAVAFYDFQKNNYKDVLNAILTLKSIIKKPGVLSYQQILCLTKVNILVYDSSEDNISAASYDLTLNKEHFVSGVKLVKNSKITIDPLDFIIARADETANIPSNICATFDIRVSMFCKGIILSNGPQVDPGYMGRFLCLLYNASSKTYETRSKERFCTVVFQVLSSTKSIRSYSGKYQRKSSIDDYVVPYATETISTNIQQIKALNEICNNNSNIINSHHDKLDNIDQRLNTNNNEIIGIKKERTSAIAKVGLGLSILGFICALTIAILFSGLHRDIGYLTSENKELRIQYKMLNEQILLHNKKDPQVIENDQMKKSTPPTPAPQETAPSACPLNLRPKSAPPF